MPPRKQPAAKDAPVATTSTRTRTTRTTTIKTDELTATLATKLTISDPKGKNRAAETATQRVPSSRIRKTQAKDGEDASEVNGLAQELAAGLSLAGRSKQKSREERCTEAMKDINSASRGLSSIVESGWRYPSSSVPASRNSKSKEQDHAVVAAGHATTARRGLKTLRELKTGDIDIERAASSLVGKLIALEMYGAALEALSEASTALPLLCSQVPVEAQPRETSLATILSLSVPFSTLPSDNDILLTLISHHLLYTLIAFSYTTFSALAASSEPVPSSCTLPAFAEALWNGHTLLQWLPLLQTLPSKHIDSILTRAYTAITKSSILATSLPSSAMALFRIRIYALHLLLHTSPSILRPTTFWDQTVKFTVAFVKDVTSGSTSLDVKSTATRTVLSTFDSIVDLALQTRPEEEDRRHWFSGSGFMGFCEYWMEFARKASDPGLMQRISSYIRGRSSGSIAQDPDVRSRATTGEAPLPVASAKSEAPRSASNCKHESARIVAILTQATSLLEQSTESSDDSAKASLVDASVAIESANSLLPLAYARGSSASVDEQRYADKVRRALERLRRIAVKVLETLPVEKHSRGPPSQETLQLVRNIVQKGADVLESAVHTSEHAHVDLLTPALDSLFALARTAIVTSSPPTYTTAYDLLARADTLLTAAERYACDPYQLSNYLRCLSGAFHNIGGTLYQATQHAHAARFLKQSCIIGERALHGHRATLPTNLADADGPDDKETWAQLEDQMYRRWEILGVCHSKTGDRKMAFDSFVNCLKAFPFSEPDFLEAASRRGVSALFDSTPALKHVSTIIERMTYAGVFDLLLPPDQVSLKPHLSNCFVENASQDAAATRRQLIGALLERQIESLDSCKWKERGRRAIRCFLEQALKVYDAEEMPIRRARVILKLLEHIHSNPDATADGCSSYEELGQQAESLLLRKDAGLDTGLSHFRTRYRAILKLRLALLVHREAQTSQFSKVVAYAEEACSILKSALSTTPRGSLAPAQSPKVTRTQPGRRVVSKGQPVASRLPTARTRTTRSAKVATAVPVTPKKKRVVSGPTATLAAPFPANATQAQAPVDELPLLLNLLRACAHLLGLLGQMVTKVHLLIVARRICEKFVDARPDDCVSISIDLAQEYVNLGKLGKAGNVYHSAMSLAKRAAISEETRVLLFLRYAESQAAAGNVLKSSSAYCEAYAVSEALASSDKGLSTTQRVLLRATILERAAVAASTFAWIQYSQDDPAASINGLLQALRLWNRAIDTLSKIAPPASPKANDTASDNPFLAEPVSSTSAGGQQATPSTPRKDTPRLPSLDGIEWRVAHGLLVTLFALTQAYVARGSPREAEYFAQQAKDVAESLNTPAMIGKSLARIGEIYLHLHQVEDSHASLAKAADYAAGTAGPDAAEIHRLRAEHNRLHADGKEAPQLYDEAMAMLEELDKVFAALDGQVTSSRLSLGGPSPKSPRSSTGHEVLAPSVLMSILRQSIRLLQDEGEEYEALLERFRSLSSHPESKAEESALLAKLSLENVYTRFQADMFLNSLSESTITLPTGMVREKTTTSSAGGQEVLAILNNAERLFWSDLAAISRRGSVFDVRDAATSLALIRAFQASLGASSDEGPVLAARLLDMSAAITLQREVLEVVEHKFPDLATQDDLQWPVMTPNGSVMPPPKRKPRARFVSFDDDEEEDNLEESSDSILRKYWDSIATKYRTQVCDAPSLAMARIDSLPPSWTVVSISITEDHNTMFVTRQRPGKEPLMFCIPLKERRENVDEEDEYLGYDAAVFELKEIIRLSDEGTRQAQTVRNDRSARTAWWANRTALDERMKSLLENIEFCWLGAFKTILNDPVDIPDDILEAFRTQIESAFKRSIQMQEKKQKSPMRLTNALLECFASLSPKCRDEELADLVYFILDLYQFHGTPVATAEVDIDEVVIDLRAALEEHAARCRGKVSTPPDAHTFLVLDKNVAGIPWESLPVLRGRSISRIPSVDFLLDRVQFCKQMEGTQEPVDRTTVDPRKVYYVLNPSGDLQNTEGRFLPWLKDMASVGWEGIVGRAPSELQLSNALTRKDLVIYFGHGGAEQYIRSHKLRHLPRCAATMLWGCSSGALKEMGDFDRTGTPYNYMLAGCPTLVANLWDVTDRDIDKFSQAVFDKVHLSREHVARWAPEENEGQVSIVAAVAQSRDVCKLKYLTGAAPVVYGIPFYL